MRNFWVKTCHNQIVRLLMHQSKYVRERWSEATGRRRGYALHKAGFPAASPVRGILPVDIFFNSHSSAHKNTHLMVMISISWKTWKSSFRSYMTHNSRKSSEVGWCWLRQKAYIQSICLVGIDLPRRKALLTNFNRKAWTRESSTTVHHQELFRNGKVQYAASPQRHVDMRKDWSAFFTRIILTSTSAIVAKLF